MATETTNVNESAAKKPAKKAKKMVTIHLFKDSGKYKDDLQVGVNGKMYTVQRGKPVEVPDFVAEVIYNSMQQDAATADLIFAKQEEYNAAAKAQIL